MPSMIQVCRTCDQERPLEDYYEHGQMKNGRLNVCKSCVKQRSAEYRAKNLPKIREKDRKRANRPERIAARKAYAKTERGKERLRAGGKAWRERNPEARNAHIVANNALRNGTLHKQPCEVCGNRIVEGHHDDYTKPLEIRWLCKRHHDEHHKATRNQP